jgi:hypothetical protein
LPPRAETRRAHPPEVETVLEGGRSVQQILERMHGLITGPFVTVETLVRAMDPGAQPVLLLLPAMILVTPLCGVQGMSSLGGLSIALVASRMLLARLLTAGTRRGRATVSRSSGWG